MDTPYLLSVTEAELFPRSPVESVLDVPIRALGGQSFQSWLVRLPVKEKGMGLRSLVDIIPAAFIGSVEMSLPFFCREEGVCQLLLPTVGDIREAEVASRWQTLLDSGSRTGRELAECWDTLRVRLRSAVPT